MLLSTSCNESCSICGHPKTIFQLFTESGDIYSFCARQECKPRVELHETQPEIPLFIEINTGWRI